MKTRQQRFTAKRLAAVPTKPGCWEQQRIGVFDSDVQVGEYVYGYSSGQPFYPFELDGKWFALMSGVDYTKTDVMSLPDCSIVGGEPRVPGGGGFCPVEFYVPAYTIHKSDDFVFRMYDDNEYDESAENNTPWIYERFGFRCGCVWGDDSSWKLQMLDLSQAPDGIIATIDIGYIELAPYALRECLNFGDDADCGVYGVRVSTLTYLSLSDHLKKMQSRVVGEQPLDGQDLSQPATR